METKKDENGDIFIDVLNLNKEAKKLGFVKGKKRGFFTHPDLQELGEIDFTATCPSKLLRAVYLLGRIAEAEGITAKKPFANNHLFAK